MHVSLTPELRKFVQDAVENGLYLNASEVVRAGLRCLIAEQEARRPSLPTTLEELETQWSQAVARLDSSAVPESGKVLQRLLKQLKDARFDP